MNVVIRTAMRNVIDPQLKLGEEDIAAIVLDPHSRDDIPQLLRGLQHIYTTRPLRERVFAILAELRPTGSGEDGKASPETGRPGLSQWAILVLGVLRLGLNADYDRILELANQHTILRKMLGHTDRADDTAYNLQTLKNNVSLFTPELLDRINQAVVSAGHALVKKNRTIPSRSAVTPSWSRRTCMTRPTSICSTTRCARRSRPAPGCARTPA